MLNEHNTLFACPFLGGVVTILGFNVLASSLPLFPEPMVKM